MPHDLPPWNVVYQQSQRWIKAGVFESLVYDLRAVLKSHNSPNACKRRLVRRSRSPMLIKDAQAKTQPMQPESME
jgi:transposase